MRKDTDYIEIPKDIMDLWQRGSGIIENGRIKMPKLGYLRTRAECGKKARVTTCNETQKFLANFDRITPPQPAPAVTSYKGDLRTYQQSGYDWLWFLHTNNINGILADEMGLGKTHQAMVVILSALQNEPNVPNLVVCPTSVLDHWRSKFRTYAPELRMVKIGFAEVIKAGKTPMPVILTLVINWCISPFMMYVIATFFLGYIFKDFLPGTEIIKDGSTVGLYRSYISGAILLGIAPCTAMVLMWGYLARGNDGLTLVMVAINSLTMLVLYAPLGGFWLKVNKMPIPWKTIALSVLIYVALPLVAGYFSRKWIIKKKGLVWFQNKFLHFLTPVSIAALSARASARHISTRVEDANNAIPPARRLRPQGERAFVRLLGHLRQPDGHRSRARMHGRRV